MNRPWMPFYIADYLAGTGHLNTLQHGAYLLLILHYWAKGGLPESEDSIRQVTRLDVRSWSKNRDTLKALFHDGWKHARLDKELAQALVISKANSANARKSHEARKRFAVVPQQNGTTQSQSHSLPSGESPARAPEISKSVEGKPTPIKPDWHPNDADVAVAHELGMTDDVIDAEAAQFRRYYLARGTKFPDWHSAWASWCQRWKKPAVAAPAPTGPVVIDFDKVAEFFARTGRWSRDAGPEPGMGGCRCPKEILIKHGIDPATGFVRKVSA